MNTFHLSKVEQNGERGPKNPPVLPIAVGKIADLLAGAVDREGFGGESEADRCRLDRQKEAEENDGSRDPKGKGDGEQTQAQEDEGDPVAGGNFNGGGVEGGGHG